MAAGREERWVDVELAVEHVQLGAFEVEQGVMIGHDGGRGPGDEYIVETCEVCRTTIRENRGRRDAIEDGQRLHSEWGAAGECLDETFPVRRPYSPWPASVA